MVQVSCSIVVKTFYSGQEVWVQISPAQGYNLYFKRKEKKKKTSLLALGVQIVGLNRLSGWV